jgi:two-component system cell cycle response regulator
MGRRSCFLIQSKECALTLGVDAHAGEPDPRVRWPAPCTERHGVSTKLKVLVVDDDSMSRQALEKAVVSFGHECRTASDGLDAWQKHQTDHADVILSDWRMPHMDGLELCKRTRVADSERAYTYFIFMTGFDDKEHFLRGMEAGADDYQIKPIDLDELQARLVSAGRVVSLYRRLAEKNSALRRDSQTSFSLARIDPLTGVANRLRLNEDLGALWSQADRYGHQYSAALCDIDWFKVYNDHLGHLAGDTALHGIAQSIRSQLRRGDAIYRYGGEEFLAIFPEQSLADATQVAERMCRAVEKLAIPTVAGNGVVTMSIGVAQLTSADETVTAWLDRADSALYRAKANGRNRVEADPPSTADVEPNRNWNRAAVGDR